FDLKMEFLFNVYSAIVEVIFNGIKANAKYLIFQEEIKRRIENASFSTDNNADDLLRIIFKNDALREFINRFIVPDKIKKQTINILKLDEYNRTGKEISEKDRSTLQEFKQKISKSEVNMFFTIALGDNNIVFAVTNESPVMKRDMERIVKSRNIHHNLFKEGRSGEYFTPEYLDTTESAGLGIAMADEVYFELGIDPLEYFSIKTDGNQTRAVLKFPLSLLKN
ncbi:MAG: hypothetical protein KDK38_13985, partial [Leptospiraceae bacterium]|nr:hypothetical protein [Leptospiraceae bacterium]